jgi:hypothetical protein
LSFFYLILLDENRPPSELKGDLKRGRNEGTSSRSTTLNPPSATGTTSRRTAANTSNTNSKDSGNKKSFLNIKSLFCTDQPRTSAPARVKKMATAVSAATKKNISIVKEEDENTFGEVKKLLLFSLFL